jgi:hypothetical protein
MTNDLDIYIKGLEEAKSIVAEAFRAGYLYAQPIPYQDGWMLLNVLVRKAEEDLEDLLDNEDDPL